MIFVYFFPSTSVLVSNFIPRSFLFHKFFDVYLVGKFLYAVDNVWCKVVEEGLGGLSFFDELVAEIAQEVNDFF